MLARLLAVVAPPACLACRGPAGIGQPLCSACRATVPWLPAARCPRCALPVPCAPCPAAGAAFDAAWSAVVYDGTGRALVHALKLRGALAAADAMAAAIVANAPGALLDGSLVPVPADARRRRARGFDHADRLARALGDRSGLPVVRCLTRPRTVERQVGAGRAARLRHGRAALGTRGVPPARVVLVDDVHTTGATLDACARALRESGASSIVALTYARTLR